MKFQHSHLKAVQESIRDIDERTEDMMRGDGDDAKIIGAMLTLRNFASCLDEITLTIEGS